MGQLFYDTSIFQDLRYADALRRLPPPQVRQAPPEKQLLAYQAFQRVARQPSEAGRVRTLSPAAAACFPREPCPRRHALGSGGGGGGGGGLSPKAVELTL